MEDPVQQTEDEGSYPKHPDHRVIVKAILIMDDSSEPIVNVSVAKQGVFKNVFQIRRLPSI